MSEGTPQKLSKAISNAIQDYNRDMRASTEAALKEKLRAHLADYIRNKLGPIRLCATIEEVDFYVQKFTDSLD